MVGRLDASDSSQAVSPAESTRFPDSIVERSKVSMTPNRPVDDAVSYDLQRTVIDSDGEAISGAHIVAWVDAQRLRQTGDSKGRFTFKRWPPHGGWLFVQAAGYRSHGEYVSADTSANPMVLHRIDEPVKSSLRPVKASPLSSQLLDLAHQEFAAFLDTVMDQQGGKRIQREKSQTHLMQVSIDRDAALQLIGDARLDLSALAFSNTDKSYARWHANRIRAAVAKSVASDDVVRALKIIEQIDSTGFRIHALMSLAQHGNEDFHADILEKAVDLSANVTEPGRRVEHLAALGGGFLAISRPQRARPLFDAAVTIARTLDVNGRDEFSRSFLAWQLAAIDQQTALDLVSGVKQGRELDRCYRNIARQLVAIDAESSERLLDRIAPASRDDAAMRISYRMASEDLGRAMRITDRIRDVSKRAYATGLMAEASDVVPARRLEFLERAFAILQTEVDSGRTSGRSIYVPFAVAMSLLPTVKSVAPYRLEDFFWRALSLRGQTSHGNAVSRALGRHGPGNRIRLADPVLGAVVSRFDREQARLLTMTPGDETLALGYRDAPYYFFGSLAILDPETAVRAVSKLPDATNEERKTKRKAWKDVLSTLMKSTEERWEYLIHKQYSYWRPDELD